MMRTILVSNIPHYHHLAQALQEGGHLHRYVTSPALLAGETPPAWFPDKFRRKMQGRRLTGVPKALVTQIRWPELLQRTLPQIGIVSRERADWLNNELFDRCATRWLTGADTLHFVSSVGLCCARKAKRAGMTVICDVRQEHPAFQRGILEEESARFGMRPHITGSTYERRVLEELDLADYIFVPSRHARRTYLEQGVPASKIRVLPYGVDLEQFRDTEKRDDTFRVIYAGSITIRKGPQYLLEAFARLPRQNTELLLVGPMDPAFRKLLDRYEGNFRYVGVVPKVQLQELYSTSSVFVLPSLADSFSLATLEAMACGLPVVVSENTGAADVLTHGAEGFVTPIRNSDAIHQHLEYLRANEEARRAMGSRAARRAQELTWARYAEGALNHYRSLAPASGRGFDAASPDSKGFAPAQRSS
jgi:glycosyltransferase involved in cell wall biosynthesis